MKNEEEYTDLFALNPEQKKAFNRLARAYNDLIKLKCGVYNNYGALGFYDTAKISHYDDDFDGEAINDRGQNCFNEIMTPDSWADDAHFFHPTKKS